MQELIKKYIDLKSEILEVEDQIKKMAKKIDIKERSFDFGDGRVVIKKKVNIRIKKDLLPKEYLVERVSVWVDKDRVIKNRDKLKDLIEEVETWEIKFKKSRDE